MTLRAISSSRSLISTTTLVLATAALLTLLVGWIGLAEIERRSRGELEARLNAEVDTSALALKMWLDEQRSVAESWASEAGVQTEITELSASPLVRVWNRDRVLASDELKRLRTRLTPVCQIHDYLGFLVIDVEGRQIAALLDGAVGESIPPTPYKTIRRAKQGESVVTPPFTASMLLPDEHGHPQPNQPTMLVAAPVKDSAGTVVAILAFRLRPERQFARTLESGRPGETYAFDERGLLLSDSRFDDQLRQVGLISKEPTSRAVLALEVRDPGGSTWRTVAAVSAALFAKSSWQLPFRLYGDAGQVLGRFRSILRGAHGAPRTEQAGRQSSLAAFYWLKRQNMPAREIAAAMIGVPQLPWPFVLNTTVGRAKVMALLVERLDEQYWVDAFEQDRAGVAD